MAASVMQWKSKELLLLGVISGHARVFILCFFPGCFLLAGLGVLSGNAIPV